MYKLVIVDDEPLIQMGLRTIVNYHSLDIDVCQTANSGDDALKVIAETNPDIVLMDINIPIINGLDVIRSVREKNPVHPLFIIISSYDEFTYARTALQLNVFDYILKMDLDGDNLRSLLIKAVRTLKQRQHGDGILDLYSNPRILKEQFFMKLLVNWFDSEYAVHEMMEELNIKFKAPSYVCLYVTIQPPKGDESAVTLDRNNILALSNLLTDLLKNHHNSYVTPWNISSLAIIITLGENQENNQHAIELYIHYLNKMIRRYYNLETLIGIGSRVSAFTDIARSLNESMIAVKRCTPDNPVSDYSESTYRSEHAFNISVIREGLSNALDNYDVATLRSLMSQVTDLLKNHIHSTNQAISLCVNLIYFIDSSYRGIDYLTNAMLTDDNFLSDMFSCKSIDQIIIKLKHYTQQLIQQVEIDFENKKHWLLPSILKYVEEHYSEPISLTDISSHFNISSGYISSIFKKNSGMSITECVAQAKIKHAKKLLREPNMRIYDVAVQLGYNDPYYFSKVFKKYTGLSPREYQCQ